MTLTAAPYLRIVPAVVARINPTALSLDLDFGRKRVRSIQIPEEIEADLILFRHTQRLTDIFIDEIRIAFRGLSIWIIH